MLATGDVTTGDMGIRCPMHTILQHMATTCLRRRTLTLPQDTIRRRSAIMSALRLRKEITPTLPRGIMRTFRLKMAIMPAVRPRKVTNRTAAIRISL